MPDVSGTVYRHGSDRRIEHASVKATKESRVRYTTTDDDGDFKFDDLETGRWTLTALHEKSFPSKAKALDVMEDTEGIRIYLFRLQGNEDEKVGRTLFTSLLVGLGALIALYVALHLVVPREAAPLSTTLPILIARAEEQVANAETLSESDGLLATVGDIKANLALALERNNDLDEATREGLTQLADKLEASAEADRRDELLARLGTLERLVETPSERQVGPWDQDPWRFLEVLFWAVAGILVNKIIVVGWYLRSQRFYREGLVMHVAHLVSTPVLVLVAVLLLSLATLNVTLAGGNELSVDLSEPTVMVAVSFLLGTIPWPLWNFIEDTAERFAGRLG